MVELPNESPRLTGSTRTVDLALASTSDVLKDMFFTDCHTDVVFRFKRDDKINSVTHKAHKLVLSLWSPYFASSFYEKNVEHESEIILQDIDPDIFYFMLRCMYDDSPQIESCERALEVYQVAVKFDVKKIIRESLLFVKNYNPQASNVFYCLDAALFMDLKTTINKCSEFIQANTFEVFESCELSKVTLPVIHHLLDLPSFSLTSYKFLLKWVFDWAKNLSLNSKELKVVLQELRPQLSFLSLLSSEFVEFYSEYEQQLNENVMTEREAFSLLRNIIIPDLSSLPKWLCKETIYSSLGDRIVKIPYVY